MGWRDATPPYLDVLQFIDMRQLAPWRTNTLQDFLHSQRGSEDTMQAPDGPAHPHELAKDIDPTVVVLPPVDDSQGQDVCVPTFPAGLASGLPESTSP